MSDPVAANRCITQSHHELSQMLNTVLGPDAGPNFHTWAVWGSREAGRTIARRDVTGLTGAMAALDAVAGYGLGRILSMPFAPAALVVLLAAVCAAVVTRLLLHRASRHISHGNRMVLDEIGGVTIDFVAAAARADAGDLFAIEAVLDGLETGRTDLGGQDLLRRAFLAYAAARTETDLTRRHQLVLAANCLAVRHEHIRLQPDIRKSMPWPLRRWITGNLLDFWVGSEHLQVARDLTPLDDSPFPVTLKTLVEPDCVAAVAEMRDRRRPTTTLAGSGASDWSVLEFRMNYVVDLFRSRHLSPEVFAAPYPADEPRMLP